MSRYVRSQRQDRQTPRGCQKAKQRWMDGHKSTGQAGTSRSVKVAVGSWGLCVHRGRAHGMTVGRVNR